MAECWIVEQGLASAGSCSGRIVAAHLIPKQRIKKQYPRGAELVPAGVEAGVGLRLRWEPVGRAQPTRRERRALSDIVWDRRVVVPICGGPMGNAGHHGMLDYGGVNRLVIPREKLPVELEEFAAEYGLEWSLEADYGPKER